MYKIHIYMAIPLSPAALSRQSPRKSNWCEVVLVITRKTGKTFVVARSDISLVGLISAPIAPNATLNAFEAKRS
jgi:hypothetical protein